MNKDFLVTKLNGDGEFLTDKNGTVICEYKTFTLQEALQIISKSNHIEKIRYGFKVYLKNEEIFFRFNNITTKKKDTAESFIKHNWARR